MAALFSTLMAKLVKSVGTRKASGPRALVSFSDRYIVDHFLRFGYSVAFDQLVFTTESVVDFMEARDKLWHRPGTVVRLELPGLLIVEDAQPHQLQPTRDVIIVSLGDAQVVMGVINREGRLRFAKTM